MKKIIFFLLLPLIFFANVQALTSLKVSEFNDDKDNVSNYAKFGIEGTSGLSFRDVPFFIQTYVKGIKTIDYGCGAGRSTRFLKSLGLDVVGVDISSKFLNEASKIDQNTHFFLIEKYNIPVVNEGYDLVFSSHVLLVIPTKQELELLFKEANRVLKKGGIFIAVTGSEEMHSPHREWISYETDFPENYHPCSGDVVKLHIKGVNAIFYDYHWTNKDYVELIENCGFDILEIHYPLGREQEGYEWKSEKECSPYIVYVAKKR